MPHINLIRHLKQLTACTKVVAAASKAHTVSPVVPAAVIGHGVSRTDAQLRAMAHLSTALRHIQILRQGIGCQQVPYLYQCLQSATYQTDSRFRGHISYSVSDQAPVLRATLACSAASHLFQPFICHEVANANRPACHAVQHRQGFMHSAHLPFYQQSTRTATTTGGARKVIDEQQRDEEKQKEQEQEPTHSGTKFDRSLKARKANNSEHQSVIAHMSDVRTPRSLLKSSEKMKWEVDFFPHPSPHIALYVGLLSMPKPAWPLTCNAHFHSCLHLSASRWRVSTQSLIS